MQPPSVSRVARALARSGLTVTRDGSVWTVRHTADPAAPPAEILLPDGLPLEEAAVRQLADLASVRHPRGGGAACVCATPDIHPGDSGIAIGSVFASDTVVVPQAVGTDINCGMRLHATGLDVDRFLAGKAALVEKLRGDYLLGTRDVAMTAGSLRALLSDGLPDWASACRAAPVARLAQVDWDQVLDETCRAELLDEAGDPFPRVLGRGAMRGDLRWAPAGMVPDDGVVRDEGLATIGRGNHFVEVQVVDEILDRRLAWDWGLAAGEVCVLVHSGSRKVGKAIGATWLERAREAWPAGAKHPPSKIFPIQLGDPLADAYLAAEATAANYGSANRALLVELFRLRAREVYGADLEVPLVYDLPHNITLREEGRLVSRKGACPAHAGRPVLVPGSMGTPSYVGVGRGLARFLASASHGAGRSKPRGEMGRIGPAALGLEGVDCVTLRDERLREEAPAAYKPIGPVIEAQVEAGILGLVARMRPLLTFKG